MHRVIALRDGRIESDQILPTTADDFREPAL
jgi:hypothetical protein